MAAKLSEGLGEQVTCPICLEHYSDPRLLPCLHTYCRQCLQDHLLAKGEGKVSFDCPACRGEVQIISGDVTKLKVNFWVNSVLSLLAIYWSEEKDTDNRTVLKCNNCIMEDTATSRCLDCSMFLCDICTTAHKRSKKSNDHQLMTMDEIKNTGIPAVIEKTLICEKHKGEVIKYFCNTCQDLICRDCAIIDHPGHKLKNIDDVANEHKQQCEIEVERASNTMDNIEAVLKSVEKMKQNVEETSKATERNIDDFINKQIRALEEKRASLKEKTRKIAATNTKELAAQKDVLVMHETGLKSAIEFTEKVLTNGSNSDVLSVSKQLTSRLSKLSKKHVPEDLYHEDPQQKKEIRFKEHKFNEKLFLESLSGVNVFSGVNEVDHGKCSVALRINDRLVKIEGSLKPAFDQHLEFVVQIKNSSGERMEDMADRIQAKLSYRNGRENTVLIKSLEDDTYSFEVNWTEQHHRPASAQVMVDGKNILGSPISIY